MTLNSNAKFEEKLTLGSKNDIKNLVKFNASSGKPENLHFDLIFLLKVYYTCHFGNYKKKKVTEELCVITVNNDAKFEEDQTCALKDDMRNLAKFDSILKSQKLHFNGLLLSKAYNV